MERSTEIIRKDKIKHLHPDARAKVEAKIKMIDEVIILVMLFILDSWEMVVSGI